MAFTTKAENVDIEMQPAAEPGGQDRVEATSAARNEVQAIVPLELTMRVKWKVLSAALAFFNAGVNDGSVGALIPYIIRGYSITTAWIAIPYGVAFFGWLLVAVFGGYVRATLGTGGYMVAGTALQFLAQVLRFWGPPFGLFSATFFIIALGQAFQDSQANTFVSTIENAHRWLGMIHGCYAVGCLVGPLVAATIARNSAAQWPYFYKYMPAGIGLINVVLTSCAFRDETRIYQFRNHGHRDNTSAGLGRSAAARVELGATLKQKPVWLLSLFYFVYLGAVITAGGWVVEFLHVVRGGPLSQIGYISSAFNGGQALGRFLLVEPTYRFGEKRMLLCYAVITLALQIVFWRVPNIVVDSVMISLMGFLLGPFFATGVSVGTKLIPAELQSPGLALIFVMAQAGGAIFPAVTAVVSTEAGIGTLQPILVGLLAATVVSWFLVPDPKRCSV